ncbi:MAG: hypothetical protein RLZZ391_125 [Bacteroidota bacterium]|jgi:hypothetical protein
MSFPALSQHVILLAGQSNATGQGDKMVSNSLFKTEKGFEYDILTDSIKLLKDPAGQRWKDLEPANSGSILPAFVFTLNQKTNKPIVVISAARGGSSCHQKAELSNYGTWDITGNLFHETREKVLAALKITKTKLSAIIWMQGERDANAINDGILSDKEYKESLLLLIGRFRKEFGKLVPFYIVQTGNQSGRPILGNSLVRKMQQEVAAELKNVFIGYDKTPSFADRNLMKDHVHYNQDALNEIGIEIGNMASKMLK